MAHRATFTVAPDTKKNGGSAGAGRQGKIDMLNVAEKPAKASLLTKIGAEFITASPDKKAAEWLEKEVAKAQNGVTSQTVDLTPALARVLINRNTGNRRLSDALVASLARDIAGGSWLFNGEAVIVSRDGYLNDGQHRCEAVILANHPIKTIIIIGVERETRLTLDQGRVRTGGDFLAMDGYQNANQLSAAASLYWQFKTFNRLATGAGQRPNKSEVLRTVAENPDILKSVAFCQMRGARALGGPSLLAFVHFAIGNVAGRPAANEFIQALAEGAGLSARNPILYARNKLMIEGSRLRGNLKAELLFKAWNSHRRGETLRHTVLTGVSLPKLEK